MIRHGIDLDSTEIREFCRKWKIARLTPFGSILREDFGPNSDVDLIREHEEDADLDLLDDGDMQLEIEAILGRSVDLVDRCAIEQCDNRFIKRAILETPEQNVTRDEAYLEDIRKSAARIERFLEGVTRAQFLADEMRQFAVVRAIEVMGEAAGKLTPEYKKAHPEVAWKRLTNLRNFYIHVYRGVDYQKVWRVCRDLVPRTKRAIEPLIPAEGDDEA